MMSNKKRNRRINRSEVSSASSCEERSPAAKRPASTESNAMSSNTPAIMAAVEEEPSISQIWQVLIKIQADVTKILSDNQELRKDVESLKTSMQCHATEVDALKTQNGKLVQSNCALQSEPNEPKPAGHCYENRPKDVVRCNNPRYRHCTSISIVSKVASHKIHNSSFHFI